jgi:exopolysaccharide biosynthesis polyprenyl glycosylphosphotransferase
VAVVISMQVLSSLEMQVVAGIAAVTASIGLGWEIEARLRHLFAKRVLILGTGPTASMLIEEIESPRQRRYVVVGVVDHTMPSGGPIANTRLGHLNELADIVARVRPTHIVLAGDDRHAHLPLETLLHSRVRGVFVEDALDFNERLTGTVAIEALTPRRLILSKGFRNGIAAQATARAISVIAATVVLALVAPLLAIIAVAIKLDSRGPVLFVQHRAGRDGRPFPLLKFRTMRPCDEHRSEWVQDNSDRITRLGKWLRRFRVDELPQLLNVLRGEMNLIGPRPHPTCNTSLFEKQIAFYGIRSAVLPGITGWAQVRYGYANALEEEAEKMRYDLYYIKHRSLWLDVRIVLETIGVVLSGSRAIRVRRAAEYRRLGSPSKARRSSAPMRVVALAATHGRSVGPP